MNRGTARSVGLFVALAGLWGLSFPAISVGLESLPPLLFATLRFAVGGALLLGYVRLDGDEWRPRTREDALSVTVAGVFVVAGGSLLFFGQLTVPGGVAAILYGLIPVLTAGFAAVLLPDEPITARRGAGVGIGLLGVAVIASPDPSNLAAAESVGVAFVLGATASIALGSVLLRRRSPTLGTAAMTGWAMVVGSGLLAAGSVAVGESAGDITPTVAGVLAVLYLAVFASALAYAVYFALLAEFGPLEINLVSYLEPIVATAAGVALLGEALTAAMAVGFVLVAAGFLVLKGRAIAARVVPVLGA